MRLWEIAGNMEISGDIQEPTVKTRLCEQLFDLSRVCVYDDTEVSECHFKDRQC